MEVSIVFIALFAAIFGIWYFFLKTRNSERLALISSGADASLFSSTKMNGKNPYYMVIVLGMVILAIGLGIITGFFLEDYMLENFKPKHPEMNLNEYPQAYFTTIFIFAGLALIGSFFVIRRLIKAEETASKKNIH